MWRKAIMQCIEGCSSLIFTKMLSMLRNILPWYSKRFVYVIFCVLQTNLNKADSIFCTLSEWIGNIQSLLNCVGCVGTWVRGYVGDMSQKFAWVMWVAWVYKILAWVWNFMWICKGLKFCVGLEFWRVSKNFSWV